MPDPIEARMSFIIEQQAQFAVDIQLLKERQTEGQRQNEEIKGMIRQLVDVTMSLAHHGEETDRRLGELAESGANTDRRLDVLIEIVDKLVRRNGGSK